MIIGAVNEEELSRYGSLVVVTGASTLNEVYSNMVSLTKFLKSLRLC